MNKIDPHQINANNPEKNGILVYFSRFKSDCTLIVIKSEISYFWPSWNGYVELKVGLDKGIGFKTQHANFFYL